MALDPNNYQGLGGLGQLGGMGAIPRRVEPGCKTHGEWHHYTCIGMNGDTVVLACACGEVLWKERPKDAQAS